MEYAYVAYHRYVVGAASDRSTEDKVIGFFESWSSAASAIDRLSRLPGFQDHRSGSSITRVEVDPPVLGTGIVFLD